MMNAQANKPAFVLIPGAGGMASYWRLVVPLLRGAGYDAVALDLPGDDPRAGLREYAALVRSVIDDYANVVLVAQSLGGFTAPLAAAAPVSTIVFVNAMIPVPGETPAAWGDATGSSRARIAAAEREGYSTEFDLDTYFLHDVPESVLASDERPRDEAEIVFGSVCEFDAWPAIPVKVAAGAGDRLFPVEFQQRVARERLDVEADVLPGGHLIALSHPEPLARYLIAISG